ncbi:MAG TPA: hypothetical protein VF174_09260 [Micromonosporaceae bacterium]
MIPRIRMAVVALSVLALAGLAAGCGGSKSPGGTSSTGPGPATATAKTSATPTATTAASGSGPLPGGTVLLLSLTASNNGIYGLRDGQVSLWYGDNSFVFAQSAVVSPKGTLIAYIGAGDGDNGPLLVISGTGSSTALGPDTLTNIYLPMWAPDGQSVLAVDGDRWVRIAVPGGTVTPMSTPNGYHVSRYSPDLAYLLMANASGSFVARADGSGATPLMAPAGKKFHRTLSLSPNGYDVIADVEAPDFPGGDPARALTANAIVDTRTGAVHTVPGGGDLRSGYYLANGDAILRVTVGGTDKVLLVSPTGAVLAQQTVPANAADYALIGYIPAG